MTSAARFNRQDFSGFYPNRPEHELVLCCSRTSINEEESSRINELLNQRLDWHYVFHFARRHSLLPLLFFQLNKIPVADIQTTLPELKKHYQENSARNTILTNELCAILIALSQAGIEAVPYKGPVLALAAYGNLSLRRFIDLDVMVRKADVLRAKEALQERGYELTHAWTNAQQSILIRTQHNLQMHRHDGVIVELHWEAAPDLFASQLQAEKLWSRLQMISLNGIAIKSFADEDLLLLLCVHGSRHLWQRLSWVCDVAELLKKKQGLSWEVLLKLARSSGNTRKLLLGLLLARRLFNAELSDEVGLMISADTKLPILTTHVENALFNGTEQQPATIKEIFKFNIMLRQGWKQRWCYCRHILRPTDGDVGAVALPSVLTFGYYLMRPWRLMRDYRHSSPAASLNSIAQINL